MPITWRNINAPDFSGASDTLDTARKTIGAGFTNLGDVLAQQQQANQKVIDDRQQQALIQFKDLMNSARTPEELEGIKGRFDVRKLGSHESWGQVLD